MFFNSRMPSKILLSHIMLIDADEIGINNPDYQSLTKYIF